MKKTITLGWLTLLIFLLIPLTSFSENVEVLTRGEFIKGVIEHLEVTPQDSSVPLPKDVAEDSPYATAVRVLKERNILKGYPDGTYRLNQPITHKEASYVVGRLLNIEESQALAVLKNEFNINLEANPILSKEYIHTVFNESLVSDESAVQLMNKLSQNFYEANSYEAKQQIFSEISLKNFDNSVEESIKMSGDSLTLYHLDEGIYQQADINISGGDDIGKNKVSMEYFISPNGGYMQMFNHTLDEEMYHDIPIQGKEFENFMEAENRRKLELYNLLNNEFIFYRDKGEKQINGKTYREISFTGKVDSVTDLLDSLGGDMSIHQMTVENSSVSFSLSGVTYIDEEAGYPYWDNVNIKYNFYAPEDSEYMEINYEIEKEYSGFNHLTKEDFPKIIDQDDKSVVETPVTNLQ